MHNALLSKNLYILIGVVLHIYALFGTANPFGIDLFKSEDPCATYLLLMTVAFFSAVIAILTQLYVYAYGHGVWTSRIIDLTLLIVLYLQGAAAFQSQSVGQCGDNTFDKGDYVLAAGILSIVFLFLKSISLTETQHDRDENQHRFSVLRL